MRGKFDRHLYCCTEADLAVRSESALRPPFFFCSLPPTAAHCKTHQKLEIFGNFVASRSAGPFVGRHFLLERHFAGEMISVGKARRCPFNRIIAPLGRRPQGLHRRLLDVTLVAVKGLSRCRLVGSCVLPGEDFFT